jgi:DTW domain-containing protein YfiP
MVDLPTVRLAPGAPSAYRVRKETKSEGLATIEAIARALGVIEGVGESTGSDGPTIQHALEDLMRIMVERTMASRSGIAF